MGIRTSIVVPVYNSDQTIIELIEKIKNLYKKSKLSNFELILVNDGSDDDVAVTINDRILNSNCSFPIHFIELSRNFGQKGAILAGWKAAKGDIIVTIDDDLQWDPRDIPTLLSEFSDDVDVVYATPERQKGLNPIRKISSFAVDKLYMWIYSSRTPRSSFFAIRGKLASQVVSHTSPFLGLPGVISWYTQSFSSVPVTRYPRRFGKSGHSSTTLIKEAMDIFLNQSIAPLVSAVWIGFLFSAIGFVSAAFYTVSALMNDTEVPGWASIFVSLSLFSSVILFILGLMSEYVGRMHVTIVGKPQYFIKSSISNDIIDPDAE